MTAVTPIQKTLVQRSFRKVAGKTDLVADVLYRRLFEISPESKLLFKCEMRRQGRKLIQAFAVAVIGLDDPSTITEMLRELGKRHERYGAKIEDYRHLGEALIYALEQTLGDEFTPDVREAWTVAYGFFIELATASQ
jgi:hemoglobin-like flavoprotein